MSAPTRDDPLGLRPDPADFGDMLNGVVDARIEMRLRGRTNDRFSGIPDMQLVQELMARGWAVFYPAANKQ